MLWVPEALGFHSTCRARNFLALICLTACAPATSAGSTPEDALPAALRLGSPEVTLNGARQYYRVAGITRHGVPPVVFLHGGPGQGSEHFGALAGPHLEPHVRMASRRGHHGVRRHASGPL